MSAPTPGGATAGGGAPPPRGGGGGTRPPGEGEARREILRRIGAALADRPAPAPVARDYRRAARPGTDVVELFAENAADYKATVRRVTEAELPGAVAAAIRERG